jgi:DNA repair exonuclease SbcCD nuclease subunit
MPRFLHLADIHLGFDRYGSAERTKDFFYAFNDAIERYAIQDPVDFVVIAGDLFEHRMIQPGVLNQAQVVLSALKDAGIPVFAIEGNHDNRPYGISTSWLRYLSDWGLLHLLEPETAIADGLALSEWDGRRGGYIDLDCGVRIVGSSWYGTSAPTAIRQLANAIAQLPPPPAHTIVLFHHGLEGQIARYRGALRYDDLLPLKEVGVDYLALGHIHKQYTVEDWVFNPGSIEANSIEESGYQRGVFQVELTGTGIAAQLQQNYEQRPIVRLRMSTQGNERIDDVIEMAQSEIDAAIAAQRWRLEDQPIVELKVTGHLGFNRLDLDIRELQQRLKNRSNALVFLLKFEADSVTYATPFDDSGDRHQIEQEIYTDLLTANSTYKSEADQLSTVLIDVKRSHLDGASEEDLYAKIAQLYQPSTPESSP